MFRTLVVLLALLGSAVAFRPIVSRVGLSSTQRSIRALYAEPEPKDKKGTWTVADDTAEVEWGSSTDIKRAAENQAQNSLFSMPSSSSSKPAGGGLNSAEGTTGFDVGLLIAFPIMIGTLGLFFLFPLLGPQFAATLPEVPKM